MKSVTLCGRQESMSRMTLSERTAIEAGIYGRLSFQEIAKKIRKNPKYVSQEILQNRTLVKGEHPGGNDCYMATSCQRKGICGNTNCIKKCVYCRDVDCRTVCNQYDNSSCGLLSKPPYDELLVKVQLPKPSANPLVPEM